MTRHTNFSGTEWVLLGDAPMAAAAAVAMASPGGGQREARAMITGWREVGRHYGQSELMGEIIAQLDPERQRGGGAGYAYANIAEEAVGLCGQAVALLERTATPQELDEYCSFVLALAEGVASAHSERGLFGLGGDAMSSEERMMLGAIARALGYRRA
jgi:hypothetical protein